MALPSEPDVRIEIVVHPQSIMHAWCSSATAPARAHLGHPDMSVPIEYALGHPERVGVTATLDLADGTRTFEAAGLRNLPHLRLAWDAAAPAGTCPAC